MLDFLITNFYLISGSILSACFIAHLVYRNNRINRLNIAAAEFRSAIHIALEGLYPIPVSWPDNITAIDTTLRNRFPAVQVAVAEFRPFVTWWKRRCYDRAWLRYRCAYEERMQDNQCYHHYMEFDSNENPKGVFHSNVSKLLSYAK